ncbi:MAG: SGNH/GDSL hydrolase family protein, partial [Candidatus Acidiferrales bacterium]
SGQADLQPFFFGGTSNAILEKALLPACMGKFISDSFEVVTRVRRLLLFFSVVIGLAATFASGARAADSRNTLHVLFIGNSYTYYNNLPKMLEQMSAAAKNGPRIETRMVIIPGGTLKLQWQLENALKAIQQGGWDFVVLQEQSTFGASWRVDGLLHVNTMYFYEYARLFNKEIGKIGAKTVMFQTWPHREAPQQDRQALDYAQMEIAREIHAMVAPVSLAWQIARKEAPEVSLYWVDDAHPSPGGTYLAACVFYATLTGRKPNGMPNEIIGPAVDDGGKVSTEKPRALVTMSDIGALLAQQSAWSAYQKIQSEGGYLKVAAPQPEPRAELPPGRHASAGEFDGKWSGETRLYPRGPNWPAKMELQIHLNGESCSGELRIDFPASRERITRSITDCKLTADGVAFIDPKGPEEGVVKYTAHYTGSNLIGDAEMTAKDGTLFGVGRWNLKREK